MPFTFKEEFHYLKMPPSFFVNLFNFIPIKWFIMLLFTNFYTIIEYKKNSSKNSKELVIDN